MGEQYRKMARTQRRLRWAYFAMLVLSGLNTGLYFGNGKPLLAVVWLLCAVAWGGCFYLASKTADYYESTAASYDEIDGLRDYGDRLAAGLLARAKRMMQEGPGGAS